MSSDQQGQTKVGGTAASIGQVGAREGGLSAAMKRAAVDNASVAVRLKDDKGEALDAALTDSAFMAKTDGDLKALSGADLLEEMRNNPLTQAKSGTAWAQVNIARAGLDQEVDKLIEGTPVVKERVALKNVQDLMTKPLTELSRTQVRFLQDNLRELGLYKGRTDGDTNPQLIASLDSLAKSEEVLQKAMDRNGGRATLDFIWAARMGTADKPKQDVSGPQESSAPSGQAKIMAMFAQARDEVTAAPARTPAPARDPRITPAPAPV